LFKLNILTPEKRLLADQEIEEVVVPGWLGQLDVLPGHSPLVTTLTAGILKYRLKGESGYHPVAVSSGYMEVHPEGVVVLAETAETPAEVDRNRAENSLKKAQQFLSQLTADPEEIEKYQRQVERALARLDLVNSEKLSH
jgi:F-type H+-transporting ATPase subunit epsilon